MASSAPHTTPAVRTIMSNTSCRSLGELRMTLRDVWTRILRRENLRYRKPHTLRHSFASLLIEAGEPLTYIQQQLGHHSPAFTLAVYGHLLPRGDRRAVDRLDDELAPSATVRNPRATGNPQDRVLDHHSADLEHPVSNSRR